MVGAGGGHSQATGSRKPTCCTLRSLSLKGATVSHCEECGFPLNHFAECEACDAETIAEFREDEEGDWTSAFEGCVMTSDGGVFSLRDDDE